jgi:ribulose-phosphate 3-epimerase
LSDYKISASLLSADAARLGEEAKAVIAAAADSIHFDAMDNHYVSNLTMGPFICAALRRYGIEAPIYVHLMVEPVDRLIVDFAQAGASGIIFHPDASSNVRHSLNLIREQGCKAALALKPRLSEESLRPLLDDLDFILVMSVEPGFGGQEFIPETLDKITRIKKIISEQKRDIGLSVDGGIKIENIAQVALAGADTFVSGSGIFKQADYSKAISEMREHLLNVNRK